MASAAADALPNSPGRLPVVRRDGILWVKAAVLEQEAQIAVKPLPGQGEWVACGVDRCAKVAGVIADGDQVWVPVAALGGALGLTLDFDEDQQQVTLSPVKPSEADADSSGAGVGTRAPSLSFTTLDGATVSLDALRGQRVLVNSWASW